MRTTPSKAAAALALATTGLALFSVPAHAGQKPAPSTTASLQRSMDAMVRTGTAVGVQARLSEGDRQRVLRSGTATVAGGRPVPTNGSFRMGSVTKAFASVTVLQLVGEGRIGLDDPIGKYLPGLLPRENDITVRMILQHTAGIPDYTSMKEFPTSGDAYLKLRFNRFTDEGIVRTALTRPLDFEPGAKFSYSNTGYVVVGMLIKAVTGHSWQSEVTERVIKPLGLRGTSAPTYSTTIPGPHAHGYLNKSDGEYVDVTRLNPSIAGAGGAMITTTADLTTFLNGLVTGKLLKPAQFTEMRKTVPIKIQPGDYGLGLISMSTSCGRKVIGHNGGIPGYLTSAFTTLDGRTKMALSVNQKQSPADMAAFSKMIDSAFCS
ncbi:serine hydrolase domain-containing protein [Streptosporangium sp. NPDC049376]|uniref:serine hydrolase domain-containing protein n=1 Tax=Streptosporangium sp. NPDC049376 TaxID=3366192 RepID=UPI0037AE537C